jgi:hypothetical protein
MYECTIKTCLASLKVCTSVHIFCSSTRLESIYEEKYATKEKGFEKGGGLLHHHGYTSDASWGKQATDTHYAVTSRYRKATVYCVGDVCVLFLLKRRRSG